MGHDIGKPFQVHDSGSVDTCSDAAAMPLSRPPTGDGRPVRHHEPWPTDFAGPSFPSALSQRPAQILACVLEAAQLAVLCASRLERPPGWFGRLVAGGGEKKAAYECAWEVETKHPSARNKPEALQFRYDAAYIACMAHGIPYSTVDNAIRARRRRQRLCFVWFPTTRQRIKHHTKNRGAARFLAPVRSPSFSEKSTMFVPIPRALHNAASLAPGNSGR